MDDATALLGKIRAKYPQYDDLSDSDLGSRIYKKYPDAYPELSRFSGQSGVVDKNNISTYMPSEDTGPKYRSSLPGPANAAQAALMQRKPAFAPTPGQMSRMGPMQQETGPMGAAMKRTPPQGTGYDVVRGVAGMMLGEPFAKGYYTGQSDPRAYDKFQTEQGFFPEARRTAMGSVDPNQALPLMAGGPVLGILPKKVSAGVLAAIAANQAKAAYEKYEEGDPGAGAFQGILGLAAGLGAKKLMGGPVAAASEPFSPAERMISGIEGQGATIPDMLAETPKAQKLTKAQAAEIKRTLKQAQALRPEIQRFQQMNTPEEIGIRGPASVGPDVPIIRPGRTGKGASLPTPTLPPGSEIDNSQSIFGMDQGQLLQIPPDSSFPFTPPHSADSVYLQDILRTQAQTRPAAPKSSLKPQKAAQARESYLSQGRGKVDRTVPATTASPLEPQNLDPVDVSIAQMLMPNTQITAENLAEIRAFRSHMGERQGPNQPETPAATELPVTTPSKAQGLKLKKGNKEAGAFDTEILRDIADRARNIFDETASFTKRTAPLVFQKAKEYDNSPEQVQAAVEKIGTSLRDMTPANKNLFQTMINADKQLARGVAPPIKEDLVKRYFSQPDVQAALPKYRQAVDEIYSPLRQGAGYGQNNLTGKYSNAWSPSVAESHMNQGGIGPSAPGSKPIFVANKIQGEQQFTGTGTYHPGLEFSHEYRLSGLTRASGQRQVLKALKDSGALKPVPENFDGTMQYNGQTVPAQVFPLEQYGIGAKDLNRIGLPDRAIIPADIAREIKPPFEKSMNPAPGPRGGRLQQFVNSLPARAMKGYLYSTGELGAHAITLPSIAGATVEMGSTGMKGLDAMLNAVGPLRNMARMKDMVGLTKFTPEEIANARVYAAKAGVYRENPMAGKTGIEKGKAILSSPGTSVLYGNRGIFNNVVTGMVKVMKSNGATDAQIQEALSRLPNKSGSFIPEFQKVTERIMGPGFYSTGKAALKAGYKSMTPKRIVGALVFYEALTRAMDEDHKSWWERGLMPGEFIRGTDSNGKKMKWDAATLDRTMRVMREIPGRVWQDAGIDLPNETGREKALRVGETAVNATVNQITRPVFSGPTVGALSGASGIAPYAVKSSDYTGPKVLNTAISKLPLDDQDRLKALLEALLPSSQLMLGDTNSEYRSNAPEDQGYQNINRLLRAFGQMPGKTWDEDAAYRNGVIMMKGRKEAAMKAKAMAGK